jgi:proteic killer suppression protein
MEKACSKDRAMVRKWGPEMARKLRQRLAELRAADTLDDMRHVPSARCHGLTRDRKGQLAVDLVHPRRLLFVPDHDPLPVKPDGGLDWTAVKKILVLSVEDYH